MTTTFGAESTIRSLEAGLSERGGSGGHAQKRPQTSNTKSSSGSIQDWLGGGSAKQVGKERPGSAAVSSVSGVRHGDVRSNSKSGNSKYPNSTSFVLGGTGRPATATNAIVTKHTSNQSSGSSGISSSTKGMIGGNSSGNTLSGNKGITSSGGNSGNGAQAIRVTHRPGGSASSGSAASSASSRNSHHKHNSNAQHTSNNQNGQQVASSMGVPSAMGVPPAPTLGVPKGSSPVTSGPGNASSIPQKKQLGYFAAQGVSSGGGSRQGSKNKGRR
jgi:hypothetical protein